MTVTATDSIVKVEPLSKEKRQKSALTKLHREDDGFTICASGTPSIPSRYLTIISSNGDKHGFQQTAKRFQYDVNDRPGPGSYQPANTLQHQLTKPSDSKLGSGGLAAKSHRRNFGSSNSAPSPGTYNIAGNIGQRHDFSRKYSSMFQKPIAERVSSSKSSVPAPNQYDVFQGLKTVNKTNNVTATAAFRSKTKRANATIKTMDTPAPGAYDLDDRMTHLSAPILQSSFKSTSKRDAFATHSDKEHPGPGAYCPFEPLKEEVVRQLLPRRHYLAISAPAVPPPPEIPLPGPGAYNIRDFKDLEKKYMSSAAFVSSTSRWTGDLTNVDQPGPGTYSPHAPNRQSFNFNFERKWM